jgi:hypothetical protein
MDFQKDMSSVVTVLCLATFTNIIIHTVGTFVSNSTYRTSLTGVTRNTTVNKPFFLGLIFGDVVQKIKEVLSIVFSLVTTAGGVSMGRFLHSCLFWCMSHGYSSALDGMEDSFLRYNILVRAVRGNFVVLSAL